MKRSRRLILIAALALLAGALAAGLLFQSTTREALERAEVFRFRRMIVSRQGPEGAYRFFYATNRIPIDATSDGRPRFGNEGQPTLSFGRFDTEIEPSLGIGMLIDPSDWFQNEEIRFRGVEALARADFLSELRAQVDRSPNRSLLLTVHGFRERFRSALRKTAFVGHVLDIDAPLLVFDWPGDQGSTPRGYRRAQQMADASGEALARLLESVMREVQPDRLWLVANSMGAEVVVQAIDHLYTRVGGPDAEAKIDHVVLTAPDVDHEDFGLRFRDRIAALTDSLTVYVSSNDRALLMSRILNRGRRLGESTVDPSNPDPWDAAMRTFDLVGVDGERVTLVDVTPVNRTRNFHNFSLETPEFFDDLFLRLVNPDTPHSRLLYPVRTDDGRTYWVLTRGR